MKLFIKITRLAVTGIIIASALGACATYVPIKSVRPPTIDTSGIQRLAIKPFTNRTWTGGSDSAQITRYLTETAEQLIKSTGKFTIVAPTDPNADGVFTGEVRSFVIKVSQEKTEKKDKDGKPYTVITYNREVQLEFSYSVISSRTDLPVGTVVKQGYNRSGGSQTIDKLTDTLVLARGIVDSQMRGFTKDIVPTIVSVNRQLMNETSKDKYLKQRMKEALVFVKNRQYEEAARQFDQIYSEYGNTAAKTNAGILRESIASDIASRTELDRLFNDSNGLADKAVKNALDRLNLKLPSGANIMIMKVSSAERNIFASQSSRSNESSLLDYAVNQMTMNIIQAGRNKVVDRSNQTLIDAEMQYQLSGSVDDNSMVSIGHQLGVQYIVTCWISGEKSLRRLNQKIMNIETAQIIDQIDFEI